MGQGARRELWNTVAQRMWQVPQSEIETQRGHSLKLYIKVTQGFQNNDHIRDLREGVKWFQVEIMTPSTQIQIKQSQGWRWWLLKRNKITRRVKPHADRPFPFKSLNTKACSLTCMYIQTHLFSLFLQWFLFCSWGWQYFQKDSNGASSVLWHLWRPLQCVSLLLSAEIKTWL